MIYCAELKKHVALLLIMFSIKTFHQPITALSSSSSSSPKLLEKTALVTGATDGIGLTTAKNLAKKGYRVIVHGRNPDRIKSACDSVRKAGNTFECAVPCIADLSTIVGCQQLVSTVEKSATYLDLLVNNAGVFAQTKILVGEYDLEETFAVNVLAPFIITSLLLKLLTEKDGSRIIFTSSTSQCSAINDWGNVAKYENRLYSGHTAYSESKLMDAMLTMEFADRLKHLQNSRVTVNTLDPGTVNTKMLLAGWGPCGIQVEDALDETWLSTSDDLDGVSGKYFVGRRERMAGRAVYDLEERRKLWDLLCGFSPKEVLEEWNNI